MEINNMNDVNLKMGKGYMTSARDVSSVEEDSKKLVARVAELEDTVKQLNDEKTNLMRKLQIIYKMTRKYLMTERGILRQEFDAREGLILFLLACANANLDPFQLESCIKRAADNEFPDLKQLICKSGECEQIKLAIGNFKAKQAVSDQIENYEELLTSFIKALHGVNILPAGLLTERKKLRRYLAKIVGVKRTAKQESNIEDNDEKDRQYHSNTSSNSLLSGLDPKFSYRSPLLINSSTISENILRIKKKFIHPTLKPKLAVTRKAKQRQRSGQQTKQETKPLAVVTTENSRKSRRPTKAGSHPLKPSTPKKATKDTTEEGDQTTELDLLTNDLNLSSDDSDFETETVETKVVIEEEDTTVPEIEVSVQPLAVKKTRKSRVKSKIGYPTIPVAVTSASCEKSKLEQQVKQAEERRATVGEEKVEEEGKKELIASVVADKAAQNATSRSIISSSFPFSEEPEPETSNPKDVIPKLKSNARTTKIPTTEPKKYEQEVWEIVNNPSFGENNDDGVLSLELPDDNKQILDSPLSPPNLPLGQALILQDDKEADLFMTKNFVRKKTAEVQENVQLIIDSLRIEHKRLPVSFIARSMIRLIANSKLEDMQELSDYWDVLVEVVCVARGAQVNLTKILLNEFRQKLVFNNTAHFDEDVLFAKYGSFFGCLCKTIKNSNKILPDDELQLLLRDCLYWRPKSVFSFAYELSRQYAVYFEMNNSQDQSVFKQIILFTLMMDSEFSRDEHKKRLQNLLRNELKLEDLFAGMTLDEFVSVTMQEFKSYENISQIREFVKFFGALCINVDWNWLVQFIKVTVVELIKDFKENKITKAILTSFFNMIGNIVHDRRNWGDVTVLVDSIRPLLDIQHEDSMDIKTTIQACFKKVEEKQKLPIPFATGNYVRPAKAKKKNYKLNSMDKNTEVFKSTDNAPGNKKGKNNNIVANNNNKGKKPTNKAARNNNKAGQNSKKGVASRNQKNMEVAQPSTISLAFELPLLKINDPDSRKREASNPFPFSPEPISPKKWRNDTRLVSNSSQSTTTGDSGCVVGGN